MNMSQQVVGPLDGMEGLRGEGSHRVGSSEGVERVGEVRRAESQKYLCRFFSVVYGQFTVRLSSPRTQYLLTSFFLPFLCFTGNFFYPNHACVSYI